jgi:hypothetical protein
MKALIILIMIISLSSCKNGGWGLAAYNPELHFKCEVNPYDNDCFQPPVIFQGGVK